MRVRDALSSEGVSGVEDVVLRCVSFTGLPIFVRELELADVNAPKERPKVQSDHAPKGSPAAGAEAPIVGAGAEAPSPSLKG